MGIFLYFIFAVVAFFAYRWYTTAYWAKVEAVPSRVHRRGRAIIIGCGWAGMLAARILADYFEKVTIIERDTLDDEHEQRRGGVPQGGCTHLLMAKGMDIVNKMFNNEYLRLVIKRGAVPLSLTKEWMWHQRGSWRKRADVEDDITLWSGTRWLYETSLRKLLLEEKNIGEIEILQRTTVCDLTCEADQLHPLRKRVTGVSYRMAGVPELQTASADLVVDCAGKKPLSSKWLANMGVKNADSHTFVHPHVCYTSWYFDRILQETAPGPSVDGSGPYKFVGIFPDPVRKIGRLAILGPIQNDRWQISMMGMGFDKPPVDYRECLEFARGLAHPCVASILEQRFPIPFLIHRDIDGGEAKKEESEKHPVRGIHYAVPASTMRHFAWMRDFPSRYLVIGDALCNVNPVYGQGMSMAAIQVDRLRKQLKAETLDLIPSDAWLPRLQSALDKTRWALPVDILEPWTAVCAEDLNWPTTTTNASPPLVYLYKAALGFVNMVHHASAFDTVVYSTFLRCLVMRTSLATMLHPATFARILYSWFFRSINELDLKAANPKTTI
jgi:2-polyprenyl-6-methoxyphenol hydroxylase-like FAD-dependent oxidoreductase